MLRAIILSCALLSLTPVFARESTDVIVMKNGDHITCEIKGLDAGVLYISPSYVLGTISVQWSKVERMESRQLFLVKTEDGLSYIGTLRTSENNVGRPVEIQIIQAPEKEVVLDRSRIIEMDPTSQKFLQRFNGVINTGITYSKGNQSTQFNLSSQVGYPRERWSAGVSINSNLTSSTGSTTSTRNQLGVNALRLLRWDNWFYEGLAGFLQSSEQGIDLQTLLGAGIGHYFKNTNRSRISLLGGFAWQDTNYKQSVIPLGTQEVAAALVAANLQFFRFNKTNLNIMAQLLPALSQPGRVFLASNATYYIKLSSNLSWNVSFYGNWDNQPPAGFSGSDYGTSSGLSITFGTKP